MRSTIGTVRHIAVVARACRLALRRTGPCAVLGTLALSLSGCAVPGATVAELAAPVVPVVAMPLAPPVANPSASSVVANRRSPTDIGNHPPIDLDPPAHPVLAAAASDSMPPGAAMGRGDRALPIAGSWQDAQRILEQSFDDGKKHSLYRALCTVGDVSACVMAVALEQGEPPRP
jgi:hypothetical protein